MRSNRRILVAIKDPETRSVSALNKAAQLARGLGAQLELFHALTWPIYADSEYGFEEMKAQDQARATKRLQALAARLGNQGPGRALKVSISTAWDSPVYEAVIRRACAIKADLIVAEQHHGRHVAPSLLHFNDWELLRQIPVPVLLVKHRGPYSRPVVLAAVDPTHSMDKPAELDAAILDISAAVATALRGKLHSVHAYVSVPNGTRPTHALDAEAAAKLSRKIAAHAQRRYQQLLDRYQIKKARRHLLNLPPTDAIEAVAVRAHRDSVALGAVSRSGWQRLLIGNTAEALLDPLPCDLLIVKPPHFKLRMPRRPTGARFALATSMTP
jgi:universal stress protein E